MGKFQSSTIVWFNDDTNTGEFLKLQGRSSLNENNIHMLAFDKVVACIDYIKENTKEKIIIIISDNFTEIIVEKLELLQNLVDIYSLCKNEQDEVQFKELIANHIQVSAYLIDINLKQLSNECLIGFFLVMKIE